jgi:uncharacterized protein
MGNDSRRKAAALRQREIRSKVFSTLATEQTPRFVADVMLGRLAKWLRIAGFDVLYSNSYTDDELVELSQKDGRVLLSRDTRLLIRKSVKRFIFLESEKIGDQVKQILSATKAVELPALLGRCVNCNEVLIEIPREQIRDSVPLYVYETQFRFKSCPGCQKIYWAGTHRQSVVRTFEKIFKNLESESSEAKPTSTAKDGRNPQSLNSG